LFTGETLNTMRSAIVSSLIILLCSNVVHANGIYYSQAGLKIELSETIENAIDGGIALTFESEFAHIERFLFLSWPEQIKRHTFTVSRHALSNRYLVQDDSNLAPSMFRSKRETMSFIANQTLSLFEQYHRLDQGISSTDTAIQSNNDLGTSTHNRAQHQMRLHLSATGLPAPLRLSAFINNEWKLDSGWNPWQSAQ